VQTFFRRRQAPAEVAPVPLVVPKATIDGWTLEGTSLARSIARRDQREMCTLLHGVAVKVDTAYTYVRAAEMLDQAGEKAQAFAVCEAWLAHPAAKRHDNAHDTRVITRHRDRLRARLASS
jgi:hypothetical protein